MTTDRPAGRLLRTARRWFEPALLVVTAALLAAGGLAWAAGAGRGLSALLQVHYLQEEENYVALAGDQEER